MILCIYFYVYVYIFIFLCIYFYMTTHGIVIFMAFFNSHTKVRQSCQIIVYCDEK